MRKFLLLLLILTLAAFFPSVVEAQAYVNGTTGYVTSGSIVISNPTTAGNTIALCVNGDGSNIFTPASSHEVFTSVGTQYTNTYGLTMVTQLFIATAGVTGADSITVNLSNPGNYAQAALTQYSGGYTVVDQSPYANIAAAATTMTTETTPTTTASSEIVLACFGWSGTEETPVGGTGYMMREAMAGVNVDIGIEDKFVSSEGAYTATASIATADNYTGIIATLMQPATMQPVHPGWVLITASNTMDNGVLIANGTVNFAPVNNNQIPISFRIGQLAGGQAGPDPFTAVIANGAFAILVPDTSLTWPANVCYSVTITDNASGSTLSGPGYACVQPAAVYASTPPAWCTAASSSLVGGSCNFDAYPPNLAALVLVENYGTVNTGTPGFFSYYTSSVGLSYAGTLGTDNAQNVNLYGNGVSHPGSPTLNLVPGVNSLALLDPAYINFGTIGSPTWSQQFLKVSGVGIHTFQFNDAASQPRLYFRQNTSTAGGTTSLNAGTGAYAVNINYEPGSGTGGLAVYGGGASPALWASIASSLAAGSGHTCLQADTSGIITPTGSACGGLSNPMTALGDTLYGGSGGTPTRLAGQTANGTYGLVEVVTASVAVAPTWTNAPAFSAANMTSFPTLNQNTTGTAANITATSNSTLVTLSALSLPYVQLTGAPTIPTTASWPNPGTCTAGQYVDALTNGAIPSCAQVQYSQLGGTVPTWNQSTTGNAATATALSTTGGNGTFWGVSSGVQGWYTPSGSGTVNSGSAWSPAYYPSGGGTQVSGVTPFTGFMYFPGSAAPQAAVAANVATLLSGLTGCSTANYAYVPASGNCQSISGLTNPMTTLGDLIYGGASGAPTRLAGQTAANTYALTQTGTGSASAAPSWLQLAPGGTGITTGPITGTTTGQIVTIANTTGAITGSGYGINTSGSNVCLLSSNCTHGGEEITAASTVTLAGFNLPHGSAPTSPVNGDLWTTSSGIYVRISGATVGPLGSGGGGAWSGLTAPSANLTLAMGTYNSAFTWTTQAAPSTSDFSMTAAADTGSSTTPIFLFADTASNARTGPLFQINTASSSTALPFQVTAGGTTNGVQMNTSGVLAPIGTGKITATNILGTAGTLNTLVLANATSGTITLEAQTGALGSVTMYVPATSSTLACLACAQTFTTNQAINGALNLSGGSTATGELRFSGINTTASAYLQYFSQSPYTSGTATTNFPMMGFMSGATAPTDYSTGGTYIGMNGPSGFAGNFLHFEVNGGGKVFTVSSAGGANATGYGNMSSLTLAAGAAAGSSPTISCASSITCGWNGGQIDLVVGSSPTTGALFTITDSITHTKYSACVFQIEAAGSSFAHTGTQVTTGWYPVFSSTAITFDVSTALTASGDYIITYNCSGA